MMDTAAEESFRTTLEGVAREAPPMLKQVGQVDWMMAFRDHLADAQRIPEATSVVSEIRERTALSEGAALLFENLPGSPGHRAAVNVCIRDNLARAWNIDPSELVDLMGWAMENPTDDFVVLEAATAPVMECSMDPVDLTRLPIPWHYPDDRGRYMSASIVIAEHAGVRNVSYHRQFIRDTDHVVARLVPRHLTEMVDRARADDETVSIGVVNGADPTVLLAGAMSFSEPLDELTVANSLHKRVHGRPLELVSLENGIMVPAGAEYAMAATILLEDDDEGPYVDITGTVDDVRQQPVFSIDTLHHRDDPIFHAIVPAAAEHLALMGLPRAPTIKAAVSQVCECHDVVLGEGGCGWLSAVVSITPRTEDDPRAAIMAAFGGHPSMKSVTIVDSDIDISDPQRVEWALMTRWQPDRDTVILSDQRGSSLDPTRSKDGLTSKIGYDATIPLGADRRPFTSVL